MPDLEMLLRDVRPVPDPAWATKLDARVAARFPGPPPRWKAPLIAFREHLMAIGAVATVGSLIVVLVVAGLSVDRGSDDSASSGSAKSAAAPESQADSAGGVSSGSDLSSPRTADARALAPVSPAQD